MGLVLPFPGLVTLLKMLICPLFNIFGFSMCSLMAIGFAVDTIEVVEVEAVAVTIGTGSWGRKGGC